MDILLLTITILMADMAYVVVLRKFDDGLLPNSHAIDGSELQL
jgi:hypothetical protein